MLDIAARLDLRVLTFFNELYGHTPRLRALVWEFSENDLVKSGPMLAVLLWYWFQPSPEQSRRRRLLIVGTAGALAAGAVSRSLCLVLPFRHRPFHAPGLVVPHPWPVRFPPGHEGSFPSDHAALAFGLVTAIFLLSRRLGVLAAVYTLVFVLLPRVYLGLHWPGDVLAGSVLGILVCTAITRRPVQTVLAPPVERMEAVAPALFQAGMLFAWWGLMTRFDNLRSLAGTLRTMLH